MLERYDEEHEEPHDKDTQSPMVYGELNGNINKEEEGGTDDDFDSNYDSYENLNNYTGSTRNKGRDSTLAVQDSMVVETPILEEGVNNSSNNNNNIVTLEVENFDNSEDIMLQETFGDQNNFWLPKKRLLM